MNESYPLCGLAEGRARSPAGPRRGVSRVSDFVCHLRVRKSRSHRMSRRVREGLLSRSDTPAVSELESRPHPRRDVLISFSAGFIPRGGESHRSEVVSLLLGVWMAVECYYRWSDSCPSTQGALETPTSCSSQYLRLLIADCCQSRSRWSW